MTTAADSSTGDGLDSSGFLAETGGGINWPCGFFEESLGCSRGEECRPWSEDGGPHWNATRCVPLADEVAGVGESCTTQGSPLTGLDNCGPDSMCIDVDPDTLTGRCVGYCDGSENAPICNDPTRTCVVGNDDHIAVCLDSCDPLVQDCGDGRACVATLGTVDFFCMAPGTAYEDPYSVPLAACGVGSVAVSHDLVETCDVAAEPCCADFCDLTVLEDPCPPQRVCTAFVPEGTFFGYEDIGVCLTPS
ncbi:MAG: hypothetical protein ACRBN8_29825 [Nannocystales bacterium]